MSRQPKRSWTGFAVPGMLWGVIVETMLNDVVFKIVFADPANEALLRSLLNAILGLSGADRIAKVTVLNPTNLKEFFTDKGSILDIKAHDEKGLHYNIELQVQPEDFYVARSLYYVSGLFFKQLNKGEGYDCLSRTIGISILDFELFPDRKELHSVFRLKEVFQQFELSDLLEVQYLELSKLPQPVDLKTPLLRWLHILKYSQMYKQISDVPNELKQEEEIPMAIEAMKKAYATDPVREMLESRHKAELAENTRLNVALKKGRAEGKVEGKVETAQKLRELGSTAELIEAATGLKAGDY